MRQSSEVPHRKSLSLKARLLEFYHLALADAVDDALTPPAADLVRRELAVLLIH